jgi:hypothetical protein
MNTEDNKLDEKRKRDNLSINLNMAQVLIGLIALLFGAGTTIVMQNVLQCDILCGDRIVTVVVPEPYPVVETVMVPEIVQVVQTVSVPEIIQIIETVIVTEIQTVIVTATPLPVIATPESVIASAQIVTVTNNSDSNSTIRSIPSTYGDYVTSLHTDETAIVIGQRLCGVYAWWKVTLDEKTGWIRGDLVEVHGDYTSIPVVETMCEYPITITSIDTEPPTLDNGLDCDASVNLTVNVQNTLHVNVHITNHDLGAIGNMENYTFSPESTEYGIHLGGREERNRVHSVWITDYDSGARLSNIVTAQCS